MRVDVTGSLKDVERSLGELREKMPVAATRAMNLAITKARSVAVDSIAAEIGLKKKTVRDLLDMRKATYRELQAVLSPKDGKRIPVIEMSANKTKKGITYKSEGKRKLIKGAFPAVMKSGHVGAFKRVHYGKKSPNNPRVKGKFWGDRVSTTPGNRYFSRLPIVEMLGPSLPKLFVQRHIEAAIDGAARAVYGKELDRQVALLIKQAGA